MSIFKSETVWSGNTFPHKDYIRSIGGKWNDKLKAWIVPPMTMRERSMVRVPAGVDVKISK